MDPDRDQSNEAKRQHGQASDEIRHVTSSKFGTVLLKAIISAELSVSAASANLRPPARLKLIIIHSSQNEAALVAVWLQSRKLSCVWDQAGTNTEGRWLQSRPLHNEQPAGATRTRLPRNETLYCAAVANQFAVARIASRPGLCCAASWSS